MYFVRNIGMWLLIAIALFVFAGCKKQPKPPDFDAGSLTILCLGDSITAGTHGDGDPGQLSYPGILAGLLKSSKSTVQIVNEGQNGWTVNDVADHTAGWLTPPLPNIILLQIGTNDLEQGASPAEAGRRLSLLITQIQSLAPAAHLYVSNCTPVRNDNKPKLSLLTLEEFNDLVPRVVRDHEHRGHFIVFVDIYKRADLTAEDFGPDGEHPDDQGYQRMATYWSWVLRRHEDGTF